MSKIEKHIEAAYNEFLLTQSEADRRVWADLVEKAASKK